MILLSVHAFTLSLYPYLVNRYKRGLQLSSGVPLSPSSSAASSSSSKGGGGEGAVSTAAAFDECSACLAEGVALFEQAAEMKMVHELTSLIAPFVAHAKALAKLNDVRSTFIIVIIIMCVCVCLFVCLFVCLCK